MQDNANAPGFYGLIPSLALLPLLLLCHSDLGRCSSHLQTSTSESEKYAAASESDRIMPYYSRAARAVPRVLVPALKPQLFPDTRGAPRATKAPLTKCIAAAATGTPQKSCRPLPFPFLRKVGLNETSFARANLEVCFFLPNKEWASEQESRFVSLF